MSVRRRATPGRARLVVMAALSALLTAGCAQALFGIANAPTYFGSLKRLSAHYGPGRREVLDVYAPAHARALPIVIFWHGGGWTSGRRSDYRFVGSALAARGIVAVLPDYPLYPDTRFPELLHDPARAVTWVQAHAGEFGGDPTRIVLMGHSAGAHMAAFLAFQHHWLLDAGANPGSIRGFVGLSGPYVLEPNSAALNAIFAPPYTPADWQPARFVDAQAPPTLLFHGLDDRIVAPRQTLALEQALRAARVPVESVLVPHRSHADMVAAFAWATRGRAPVLQRTVQFVGQVTRQGAPEPASSP